MASTTRQATAARRRATPKPPASAAVEPDLDFEPIRIDADPEPEDEERIPLFYIGDEAYSIPKVIPPGVALEYLRVSGRIGQEAATPVLLSRVLGIEAYTALEQSRAITLDQMEKIVGLVVDLSLGKQEKGGKAGRR